MDYAYIYQTLDNFIKNNGKMPFDKAFIPLRMKLNELASQNGTTSGEIFKIYMDYLSAKLNQHGMK